MGYTEPRVGSFQNTVQEEAGLYARGLLGKPGSPQRPRQRAVCRRSRGTEAVGFLHWALTPLAHICVYYQIWPAGGAAATPLFPGYRPRPQLQLVSLAPANSHLLYESDSWSLHPL